MMEQLLGLDSITYRVAVDRDIPSLVALLAGAGWGDVDEATWRAWYRSGSAGPSTIVVALRDDVIIGQAELRPSAVAIDGHPVPAARLSSVVFDPSFRAGEIRTVDHPLVGLYCAALDELRAKGVVIVYGLPHRVLMPVARRRAATSTARFQCVGIDLVDAADMSGVEEVDGAIDEAADLWARVGPPGGARIAIARTAEHLARQSEGCLCFGVRDGSGALAAYLSVRRRDGLVVDLFGCDEAAMVEVVSGATRVLGRNASSLPWAEVKFLSSPYIDGVLARCNIHRVRFHFGFFMEPIGPVAAFVTDPASWYLAGGD